MARAGALGEALQERTYGDTKDRRELLRRRDPEGGDSH